MKRLEEGRLSLGAVVMRSGVLALPTITMKYTSVVSAGLGVRVLIALCGIFEIIGLWDREGLVG